MVISFYVEEQWIHLFPLIKFSEDCCFFQSRELLFGWEMHEANPFIPRKMLWKDTFSWRLIRSWLLQTWVHCLENLDHRSRRARPKGQTYDLCLSGVDSWSRIFNLRSSLSIYPCGNYLPGAPPTVSRESGLSCTWRWKKPPEQKGDEGAAPWSQKEVERGSYV